jgi:agmatinase
MTKSKAGSAGPFQPINPLKSPRFGDLTTFNRLPFVPDLKDQGVDFAILGVPFDGGTTYRPGARFGPRAVRAASVLSRNYNPQLEVVVYDRLNVVDAGDITANPINFGKTMTEIERRVGEAHAAGARTLCVGGDHSITLPELRAVHKKFGKPTLVHFDAHYDTADAAWEEKYHHGTWVRRAIEEGLIEGPKIFQIGIRQPVTSTGDIEYGEGQKIHVLDIELFQDHAKKKAFFAEIHKVAGRGPVFVSFDIDAVDPAFAPGTGTPVVGGLSSLEALQCLRALKGLNLVGADLVEIAPAYDHAELTSLLGAAVVFELLSLAASN